MGKKEKDFQVEFKRSFDHYLWTEEKDGLYYKIPDVGFTNPFDCFIVCNKKFMALELKLCKAKATFNFKTFFRNREHELYALRKVTLCGFSGYVLINHFIPRKENTVYALKWKVAQAIYDEQGSIKLEDLKKCSIRIPKIIGRYGKVWDLSPILNNKQS